MKNYRLQTLSLIALLLTGPSRSVFVAAEIGRAPLGRDR